MNTQSTYTRKYPLFRDELGQTYICVGRDAKVAKLITIDRPVGREDFELVEIGVEGVKVKVIPATQFESFLDTPHLLSDAVAKFVESSKKFNPKEALTIQQETDMALNTKPAVKSEAAKAAAVTPALKGALAALAKGDAKANAAEVAAKKDKPKAAAAAKPAAKADPKAAVAKPAAKTPAEIKAAGDAIKANMMKGAKPAAKAEKPAKAPKVEKPKVDIATALSCASVTNLKETAKLTVVAKTNPKKEDTPSHKHFNLYKTGMTVAELLKKGGSRVNLGWDIAYGYVKAK